MQARFSIGSPFHFPRCCARSPPGKAGAGGAGDFSGGRDAAAHRRMDPGDAAAPLDPRRDEFFVPLPESPAFLDTATMPMVLTAVVTALFVKVLMMAGEEDPEAPAGQGTVRMLTREEWEEIQEVRPRPLRIPPRSPKCRIRTGDSMHLVRSWLNPLPGRCEDWTIDVLSDAVTRPKNAPRAGDLMTSVVWNGGRNMELRMTRADFFSIGSRFRLIRFSSGLR
ncbi:unnamed protein product [Spirodela intermedia]|uniref:Uncharacterized protein n=1 Tax=Spirodela intermedia TaxID=51605 RepID=A0A7I8JKV3_SPIIN|nr:unnamed protein product [Spirodela intermedia]CAA6670102.1 unnamed protein product [Spirodela intermedia]